jgi:hypothetical protein
MENETPSLVRSLFSRLEARARSKYTEGFHGSPSDLYETC